MAPLGVGSSDLTSILKTGEAKLWVLLVGVNEYQDTSLPSLRFPAVDCQGLGEALQKATQGFPNKEVIVHNDFTTQPPTLETVRASLEKIVGQTKPQDSVLLYFSGHGMVEPNTQQAVLCLSDTNKDDLLGTGLPMRDLLHILGSGGTNQQLLCLDTCHSGDLGLLGNRGLSRDAGGSNTLLDPAPQLMEVLRQRAAQSKGFCALLSCDQGQQSWEFPELGHGVFTYYLMRGLLGEAADPYGLIEADGLYKYVYRQTLKYIDTINHQLRLINQQKIARGENRLHPEYPLQTPKRIVEGVGELILGYKPEKEVSQKLRHALIVDGLANRNNTHNLSRVLDIAGGFEVKYFPQNGQSLTEVRKTIQEFLRWNNEPETKSPSHLSAVNNTPISLLYLRGHIEEIEDGEGWFVLDSNVRLSRSWLRQELRRSQKSQQIIILDCPEATTLENWIEDFQTNTEQGQCIIAAASNVDETELFSQIVLTTLASANSQVGLPVAKWISELQKVSQAKNISLQTWLSGTQAVIDILPGGMSKVFHSPQQKEQEKEVSVLKGNPVPKISLVPEIKVNKTQPPLNFTFDSEEYNELQQLLRQYVGLISPAILQKALQETTNNQELVTNLANYLLAAQKPIFEQQAKAIFEKKSVASPNNKSVNSSANESSVINDINFINKCQREFAYFVGPIANFMIQQILKSQPQISLSEFVKKLAERISDPKQASEFEKKLLGK